VVIFQRQKGSASKNIQETMVYGIAYLSFFVDITAVRRVKRQVNYRVDSFTKNVGHRGRSEWVLVPRRFGHHRFYKNTFYL